MIRMKEFKWIFRTSRNPNSSLTSGVASLNYSLKISTNRPAEKSILPCQIWSFLGVLENFVLHLFLPDFPDTIFVSNLILKQNVFMQTNLTHFTPRFHLNRLQVCVSVSKKCSFIRKFEVLCFLVTPILRFALLHYYWWFYFLHLLLIIISHSMPPATVRKSKALWRFQEL